MAPPMCDLDHYRINEFLALISWSIYMVLRILALTLLHLIRIIGSHYFDGYNATPMSDDAVPLTSNSNALGLVIEQQQCTSQSDWIILPFYHGLKMYS